MYSPEYSVCYRFKLSEWSKIYQTLTPEPGEGKEIFQIVPGKWRDITKREKQKSRVAIAPYPACDSGRGHRCWPGTHSATGR